MTWRAVSGRPDLGEYARAVAEYERCVALAPVAESDVKLTHAAHYQGQGLTLAHFRTQLEDLPERIAHVRAQLEHLRDTSKG
jgi:hypothetical protein